MSEKNHTHNEKVDTNYSEIIRKCYLQILNREPDDVGLNHYLNLMENNQLDEIGLVEIMKRSEEYKRAELRKKFIQKYDMSKSFYGKFWVGQDDEWYTKIFNEAPLFHVNLIEYLKRKNDVKTVLEIGCGSGIYPIKYKELFADKKYLGIDISESAIHHAKNNSNFEFICGDFLKLEIKDEYDLIFSQAVIDNVYDIDLFFSKIINACKKYAYISAFYGYYPNLTQHDKKYVAEYDHYMNKLSVTEIKKTLLNNGLQEDEFIIRPQQTGNNDIKEGTVIEIELKY